MKIKLIIGARQTATAMASEDASLVIALEKPDITKQHLLSRPSEKSSISSCSYWFYFSYLSVFLYCALDLLSVLRLSLIGNVTTTTCCCRTLRNLMDMECCNKEWLLKMMATLLNNLWFKQGKWLRRINIVMLCRLSLLWLSPKVMILLFLTRHILLMQYQWIKF